MKRQGKKEMDAVGTSRRGFLGKAGTATAMMAAASVGVLDNGPQARAQGEAVIDSAGISTNNASGARSRIQQARLVRISAAITDGALPVPPHTANGDEQRYSDHSASYSKSLLQDDLCVVNPAAWASFKKALNSGSSADFEAIILGGTHTLNGPQASYAFDLECADSSQFGDAPEVGDPAGPHVVPPFDQVNSEAYGTQLVEMYWASLLRDVAFTDYPTNATAIAAAAELAGMPAYRGPRDNHGNVTPDLLFRGAFEGETIGPHMSQLMILPTAFGQQAMSQQMTTCVPGFDYMQDTTTFLQAQNGISSGLTNQVDPTPRCLHDWRGLATWTHVDVLYQAYFVGLMVLGTQRAPLNPGSPYNGSKTRNGFSTLGGPDFAASVGEVAARALNHVWYQKWLVHLTHRPEWGGGLVHQALSGNGSKVQAHPHSNILNSQAVAQAHSQNPYGTYLLSQAFTEGSPAHPSYPTGHGTVGGACITILKFFFDGNFVIPNPMVPASDGLSLVPYTGADAGQITLNTELNKLARNVSFGHGVGAGIHWRSDTDTSLLLGEAMALSYLHDKARSYNEKFTINIASSTGPSRRSPTSSPLDRVERRRLLHDRRPASPPTFQTPLGSNEPSGWLWRGPEASSHMIVGTGVDIAETIRIEQVLSRHGEQRCVGLRRLRPVA